MEAQTGNVLIVDDNENLLLSMQRHLKRGFRDVVTASTGEKALAELGKQFYVKVIIDVNLPDINGLDLLSQIKRDSPDSSVIIMTSLDFDEVRADALGRGATGFLGKPFDIDELHSILNDASV